MVKSPDEVGDFNGNGKVDYAQKGEAYRGAGSTYQSAVWKWLSTPGGGVQCG